MRQSSRRLVRRCGVPITHKTPFVCVSFNRLFLTACLRSWLAPISQQRGCVLHILAVIGRRGQLGKVVQLPYLRSEISLLRQCEFCERRANEEKTFIKTNDEAANAFPRSSLFRNRHRKQNTSDSFVGFGIDYHKQENSQTNKRVMNKLVLY
ncbi:hypothetical protein CEXT_276421 [Caerostris extrusa]|uniref:Uncharacterized protein n=1 Tax=Caerostris extrusa TaxID=172846 RepID=A0AAV4PFE7_CAEEX|nr:hypothetical protein CEXT_276421 [Caerostris extrusa]